jgi:hypothetical protein
MEVSAKMLAQFHLEVLPLLRTSYNFIEKVFHKKEP